VKTYDKAFYVLEEFTDFILYDEQRCSIIVNIKKEFFRIVYYELKKFNFTLVHKSSLKDIDTLTLVFAKAN